MKKIVLFAGLSILGAAMAWSQCATPNPSNLSYGEQLGRTYYDLQSNSSSPNRIVNHGDGTISAVWLQSKTNVSQPVGSDRGFGYNYFDGTCWTYDEYGECGTDNHGCASAYIGWPDMVTVGTNELVFGHYAGLSSPGLSVTQRSTFGSGSWSATTNLGIDSCFDATNSVFIKGSWARAVTVGDTIHLVCSFFGMDRDTNGVLMPVKYYRSTDGGVSWDLQNIGFDLDSLNDNITGIGGDAYAIHARGNTVAISMGGWFDDWILMKSTDAGVTWNKTVIKNYHLDTPIGNDGTYDQYDVNDDGHSIVIDHNGLVHCWAGGILVGVNPSTVATEVWYPGADMGLKYWNENMVEPDTIAFSIYDIQGIDPDFNPSNNTWDIGQDVALYYMGPVCMPSASIAPNGDLVVVYSAPVEGTSNTGDTLGQSFRDLYYIYSQDNGATWTEPFNIADTVGGQDGGTPFEEDVYPMTPKEIGQDSILHLLWQGDYEPGIHLVAAEGDPQTENYINYIGFNYLKPARISGMKETTVERSFGLSPNPTKGLLVIESDFNFKRANIFNSLGEMVSSITLEQKSLDISHLDAGIYFIQLQDSQGKLYTEKIIKQ